jgi:hypothetical protein
MPPRKPFEMNKHFTEIRTRFGDKTPGYSNTDLRWKTFHVESYGIFLRALEHARTKKKNVNMAKAFEPVFHSILLAVTGETPKNPQNREKVKIFLQEMKKEGVLTGLHTDIDALKTDKSWDEFVTEIQRRAWYEKIMNAVVRRMEWFPSNAKANKLFRDWKKEAQFDHY